MKSHNRRISVAWPRLLTAWLVCAAVSHSFAAAPGDFLYAIPDPDQSPGSYFGLSIAATEDTVLIGAPSFIQEEIGFVGRAYVFDAATGELRYRIYDPAPESRHNFGRAVAIAGSRLLVGAGFHDSAAYVFTNESGELERIIENPDVRPNGRFAVGMATVGENVVISSTQHTVGGVQAGGAAFLASPATGEILQVYENPAPTPFAGFGNRGRVTGNANQVFVGETLDLGPDGRPWGTVWGFDQATGQSTMRIVNPSPDTINIPPIPDDFGFAVAANDELLVVGAPSDDPGGVQDAGTVYVFDAPSGVLRLTIPNPEPNENDEFGFAVAMMNEDILIGANKDSSDGTAYSGVAYLVDSWTGQVLLTLRSPEPEEFDFFGYTVAAAGDKLFVAAIGDLSYTEVYAFRGMPERIAGDTNRDGVVDLDDLNNVRNDFGLTGYGMYGDANRDGSVDLDDLNAVRNHFGDSVAQSVPESTSCALLLVAFAIVYLVSFARRSPC